MLARLLGLRLLRVEAKVLVVPAGTGTLPLSARGAERVPTGRRGSLLEARRCLDEGQALLARAQRNRALLQAG